MFDIRHHFNYCREEENNERLNMGKEKFEMEGTIVLKVLCVFVVSSICWVVKYSVVFRHHQLRNLY